MPNAGQREDERAVGGELRGNRRGRRHDRHARVAQRVERRHLDLGDRVGIQAERVAQQGAAVFRVDAWSNRPCSKIT
jgi:hypothetical protein